jgi:signal transduction histidine kinase
LLKRTGFERAAQPAHDARMRRKRPAVTSAAPDPDDRVARAVHELRNPLATLALAARLLRDPDPAVVEEARATIESQAARMADLLRDLAAGAPRGRRRPARRG